MPFCPNPDCPHIKRIKEPAEFVEGITHCSDCGSPLSEEKIKSEKANKFKFTNFHKRLIYTLSALALYRAAIHVAVPGINYEAYELLNSRFGLILDTLSLKLPVGILSLGILPYLSAYVTVEFLALIVNPLKKWRKNGYEGRIRLKKLALIGTVVICILQGYAMSSALNNYQDGHYIQFSLLKFKFIYILTLTAGTFFCIWIAEIISRKGIGHGISILILSDIVTRVPASLIRAIRTSSEQSPFAIIFFAMLITILLIILVIFMERSCRKIPIKYGNSGEVNIPIKLTTAGIVPAFFVSLFIMLPVTISSIHDFPFLHRIADALSPGTLIYVIAFSISTFFFYYFFTAMFFNPVELASFLKNKNLEIIDDSKKGVAHYIYKKLEIVAFFGFVYLCFIKLIPEFIILYLGFPIYIGSINFIIAVVIILDLYEEYRSRRISENLSAISELHDITKAGLLKSILEKNGIHCYLKGYYHRAILYFFGPYIEISVLVPEEKSKEALDLVGKYT